MAQFQGLMTRFLETQREVMVAYLHGPAPSGIPAGVQHAALRVPLQADDQSTTADASGIRSSGWGRTATPHPTQNLADIPDGPGAAGRSDLPPVQVVPPAPDVQPAPPDSEQLTARLLAVFSERTGYPSEVLDLDLNMESDLGCDSIKRVEIIGTFLREFLPKESPQVHAVMEALTGVRTLRGILDTIRPFLSGGEGVDDGGPDGVGLTAPLAEDAGEVENPATGDTRLPRWLPTVVDAPQPEALPALAGRTFVVTDDERGVSRALADLLTARQAHVAVIRAGDDVAEVRAGTYTADLTDLAATAEVLRLVRDRFGPPAGLVHLLPLRDTTAPPVTEPTAWLDRVGVEVRSLFNLAKVVGHDLRQAGDSGNAWLVAATALGGGFGIDGTGRESLPATHGAVAGLVKALAQEWPSVHHRVVDLQPDAGCEEDAARVLAELSLHAEVEVGYLDGRRVLPRLRSAPFVEPFGSGMDLGAGSVVLVTGGARGITAQVCRELAARYRPTLVLTGRSPLPPAEEASDTAGLTTEAALKQALIDRARRDGDPVEPARIEVAYRSLLREREIRDNLAAMRAAGATVDYRILDARDVDATERLVRDLQAAYARLDGVVHGAGVIEDALVEDKTPDSFTRVIETKLVGALALARSVPPDSLRFFVLFSSVAGRFGNRGQCDYAAANGALDKLALSLDHCWTGRVVSMNWGPWQRTGMASEAVQRQFQERNVLLIPPSEGSRHMVDELRSGRKGEVEVVVGDGPWPLATAPPAAALALPLLDGLVLKPGVNGAVDQLYELDVALHPYLNDHRLYGKPVLPTAMALELITEFVQGAWPQWQVAGVSDLRVLKGIVVDDGRRSLRITASPRAGLSAAGMDVDVTIGDPTSPELRYYRASVQLAAELPKPPTIPSASPPEQLTARPDAAEAYSRYLFHGPRFRCISDIRWISENSICGVLLPSTPAQCLTGRSASSWLIDPIVVDGAPQLATVWSRLHRNMTPLPARLGNYRRFGPLDGGPIHCNLRVLPESTAELFVADVSFTRADGQVVGLMQRLELTMSPALNDLVEAVR